LIYEKWRTTYHLDDAEIVLDEMPYGNFMEIEANSIEVIRFIMDKLGLQKFTAYRTNYIGLFFRVRKRLGLDFNDITFVNFQGIEVPKSAFAPLE
jgi:adenylate cyclase, class 2